MSATAKEVHLPEDIDRGDTESNGLHVRRLGHMIIIGNSEQSLHDALIVTESPGDPDYEVMTAEDPPHHPV